MTKGEHRQFVASFVMLDDAITRASHALSSGDVGVAERALEQAKQTIYIDAPALTVPEVADELGVSRPTVRSWITKGLLDVLADTSPVRVRFSSVQELKERFGAEGTVSHLDGLSIDAPEWHMNVRPSNTEPFLRLNLEARSEELMEAKRDEVLAVIRG